jgi:hypothetical protein
MGKDNVGMVKNAVEANKRGITVRAYIDLKHAYKKQQKAITPAIRARDARVRFRPMPANDFNKHMEA